MLAASAGATFGAPTIVYLDPTKPESSWFVVQEWPSYIFAPGAPLSVSYSPNARDSVRAIVPGFLPRSGIGGDLDCSDIDGPILIGSSDPNGFDGDGDGIGCELN